MRHELLEIIEREVFELYNDTSLPVIEIIGLLEQVEDHVKSLKNQLTNASV